MRKTAASLLLTIVLISSLCFSAFGYSSELVDQREAEGVDAGAALLVDLETDTILFQQDAYEQIYPASTTKMMTALLVMEALDSGDLTLDEMITADDSVWTAMTSDSSSQAIWPGEELSVEDLLYCMLLPSANDAANVLAAAVGGTVADFVDLMNQKAEELGCTGTHFTNVHGMPNSDHYSTAYDLYLIAKAAMQYDLFRTVVSTTEYRVEPTNMTEYARNLSTTNLLLLEDKYEGKYYYAPAIGIKTGTTDSAGNCLVSAAEKNGRTLICVMMGCHTVTEEDGSSTRTQFSQSIDLFEWGFENFSTQTLLSAGQSLGTVIVTEDGEPVTQGEDDEIVTIQALAEERVEAYLPNDISEEAVSLEYSLPESVEAPVSGGAVLGTVTVLLDGTPYAEVNLTSDSSVSLLRLSGATGSDADEEQDGSGPWLKRMIITIVVLVVVLAALIVLRMTMRRGGPEEDEDDDLFDSYDERPGGRSGGSAGSRSSGGNTGSRAGGGSAGGRSGGGTYQGRRVGH